ncbi:helix-turn-helix transcriptional regulator [Methylorubrum extorquens]|uniref:helix-turn-helix domain-containing protein n=1 Tax=Methylorubrum extorquens TaxID=408 RepID=UPI002238839A|nr:helix-turn-helix transcriptional regulator [Methylorubrum extorquens]UYW28387.1 helix-turn-helix transcriptional regulator [Methylorubrum extorquens]
MTDMTRDEVRAMLAQAVRDAGSQKRFAEQTGVSRPYLNDVLARRREPGERLLDAIAVQRVERFVSLRRDA